MAEETENDLNISQKQDILKNEIQNGIIDEQPSDSKKTPLLLVSSSSPEELKSNKKKSVQKFLYGTSTSSKVIPRQCLEKKDWINLLATPSRKYSPYSDKNFGINIWTNDDYLSLEQVEELFQKISKKKKNQKVKKIKCQNIMKLVQPDKNIKMSKDAILCQYNIAEAFVKSILQQKNVALREDLADLVKIIQKRLDNIVDTTSINFDEDEKIYHQILFLSKLIANWIAGILEEVAAQNEKELQKECYERRKRMEINNDDDDDEDDHIVDDDDDNNDNDDDDVDDDDDNGSGDDDNNDKNKEFGSNVTDKKKSAENLINQKEKETSVHDYDSDNKTDKNNTSDKENYENKNDKNNEQEKENEATEE